MKKLLIALLLLPSLALAQDVTHETIEQNYGKCLAGPHHAPPDIKPRSEAMKAQPIWDDADFAQACPAIWARWKAHRDELNSQQTKADLKAFADKLKN